MVVGSHPKHDGVHFAALILLPIVVAAMCLVVDVSSASPSFPLEPRSDRLCEVGRLNASGTSGGVSALSNTTTTAAPDSDGWIRTKSPCHDHLGGACISCCNGSCCEAIHPDPAIAPPFEAGYEMWIPVRFIVIGADNETSEETSPVNSTALNNQLKLVNQAFASVRMHFFQHSVLYAPYSNLTNCTQRDSDWHERWSSFMPCTGLPAAEVVNVLLMPMRIPIKYGYASFPWDAPESEPKHTAFITNAVALDLHPLAEPFLAHELGHYFGLLHVFQGSNCSSVGDWVNDTAPTTSVGGRKDGDSCTAAATSCPGYGFEHEPANNVMNYDSGVCSTLFTPQQGDRMQRMIAQWRPGLRRNYYVEGSCPVAAVDLVQCSCTQPGRSAESYCRSSPSTSSGTESSSVSIALSLLLAGLYLLLVAL